MMNIVDAVELTKKYAVCLECGSDKTGGEPSEGAILIEDEVFTRSCKCGWSITVDRRIRHRGTLTKKRGGKLIGGVYEVSIHGKGRKYLPIVELKELSGAKRINQHEKIEGWLNSPEGRKWALEVREARID